MSVKFTQNQEKLVIDTYYSCQDLNKTARKCGFLSNTSVKNILKRNNITHISLIPKYEKNHYFFDKIDNEAKAYFLGFMCADGNNYIKRKGNYQVSIKLQARDKHILESFRDMIVPTKPLKFMPRAKETHQDTYKLKFDSKIISNQLIELGCIAAKSLILDFPPIMRNSLYFNHFIRGYSDGDGCISMWVKQLKTTTNDNYAWQLTSSDKFCAGAKEIIDNLFNIKMYSRLANIESDITTTISIGGNRQVYDILTWLYKDATLYLTRKYNEYQELTKC